MSQISFTIVAYKVTPASELVYRFPNNNKVPISLSQRAYNHVIIEVEVNDGGKVETISFDAGIGMPGSMSLGNLGDGTTGEIDPYNRHPININTKKPVMTRLSSYMCPPPPNN